MHRSQVITYRTTRMIGMCLVTAALLFIGFAGILKLIDLNDFANTIREHGLLPEPWPGVVAVLVPVAELALVTAAACGLFRGPAVAGLAALLVVFSGYLVAINVWADAEGCGCFGTFLRMESAEHALTVGLVRNGVLLALLGGGVWLCRARARPLTENEPDLRTEPA